MMMIDFQQKSYWPKPKTCRFREVKTKPTALLDFCWKLLLKKYQYELILCGCGGCCQIDFMSLNYCFQTEMRRWSWKHGVPDPPCFSQLFVRAWNMCCMQHKVLVCVNITWTISKCQLESSIRDRTWVGCVILKIEHELDVFSEK